MNARCWSLPARAKLNLTLRIVGRRADGYHLLESLFHTLELHDDVALTLADRGIDLRVTADDPAFAVSPGPDNLVHRALQSFAQATGYAGGFAALLHKRIPHGGGLGGGSSDAAAVLRLANEVLGRPLTLPALAALAVRLGADVPFFLTGGSQWARGIGDDLAPAFVTQRHFTLLLPPFGCPTVDVYKTFAAMWQERGGMATFASITVPDTGDAAVRNGFHNDLLPAAERLRPALAELRADVAGLGYPDVAMTGSGSTLFVAHADAAAQRRCEAALQPLRARGVRCLATRSASGEDVPRPSDRLEAGT